MNSSFYLALERLPMSLVAAIEFIGTIGVALYTGCGQAQSGGAGARGHRRLRAHRPALVERSYRLGWAFHMERCLCSTSSSATRFRKGGAAGGIERLGAAMTLAFIFVMPIGFPPGGESLRTAAARACRHRRGSLLLVIPYVCDQLAMSRLPRASFALLLALLRPRRPSSRDRAPADSKARDLIGIALVMSGVANHRPAVKT